MPNDLHYILSGDPYPITVQHPDIELDADGNVVNEIKWFLAQPTTYLYDDATSVELATRGRMLNEPHIRACKGLPPTDAFTSTVAEQKAVLEKRRAELKTLFKDNGALMPEEADELGYVDLFLDSLDGLEMDLADELARTRATQERDRWLLPRLIIDEAGELMYDPADPAKRKAWEQIGTDVKDKLRPAVTQVLLLVRRARK